MNKHINQREINRKKGLKKQINDTHPEGNRKTRRSNVALARIWPAKAKKIKIEKNIFDTKEAGRKIQALKLKKKQDDKSTTKRYTK